MMRSQAGYEVTASLAIDVDSLGTARAPSAQGTAREGLSLCFRREAGWVRVRCGPGPPALFCGHVNSIFGLGATFTDRETREVQWPSNRMGRFRATCASTRGRRRSPAPPTGCIPGELKIATRGAVPVAWLRNLAVARRWGVASSRQARPPTESARWVACWRVREYWLREGAARGSPRDSCPLSRRKHCRRHRCWRSRPIADRGRVSRRESHPYPPSEARPLNQVGSRAPLEG